MHHSAFVTPEGPTEIKRYHLEVIDTRVPPAVCDVIDCPRLYRQCFPVDEVMGEGP